MTKPSPSPNSSPTNTSAYTRNVTERKPLPSRVVRLLSEARWLALAVLGLYFVLILFSFSKADPGWSHERVVANVANLGFVHFRILGVVVVHLPVTRDLEQLSSPDAGRRAGPAGRP
jgi:hypothetical protein